MLQSIAHCTVYSVRPTESHHVHCTVHAPPFLASWLQCVQARRSTCPVDLCEMPRECVQVRRSARSSRDGGHLRIVLDTFIAASRRTSSSFDMPCAPTAMTWTTFTCTSYEVARRSYGHGIRPTATAACTFTSSCTFALRNKILTEHLDIHLSEYGPR